MIFKPVNEKHLEHLVSSEFFLRNCSLEYIGPVLNPNGNVSESPDMLLHDKRNGSNSIKTCECKYAPKSYKEFSGNGNFDIAIIWSCGTDIDKLKKELLKFNNCKEVIQLSKFPIFSNLPVYSNFLLESLTNNNLTILENKLKNAKPYTSFVAYISAKIYPERFKGEKMLELIETKFPKVKEYGKKGKHNTYNALSQPLPDENKTKILEKKGDKTYIWNEDFVNSKIALPIITNIILDYFYGDIPADEEIHKIKYKI